jgi:signal transduction histidine kinase
MERLWKRPTWYEIAGVTALAVWTITLSDAADRVALAAAFGVAAALSLLLRRSVPLLPMATVLTCMLASDALAGRPAPDDPYLLMLIWASYSAGRHAALRYLPWVAFFVLALIGLTASEADTTSDLLFPVVFVGVPWLAGLALQLEVGRARRAEGKADALTAEILTVAGRAEVDERLRIARELHDVMGHTLIGLSLQLQTLRRGAAAGQPINETDLRLAEDTTGELLVDIRRLVGLLKSDVDAARRPLPGVEDLDELVRGGTRHGQDAVLTMVGDPRPLPPALSTALFRICQEALANAAHHGADGPVRVRLEWAPESVSLVVRNGLRATSAGDDESPPREGHGLLGMSERAELHGGTLRITKSAQLWTVSAHLPTPAMQVVS